MKINQRHMATRKQKPQKQMRRTAICPFLYLINFLRSVKLRLCKVTNVENVLPNIIRYNVHKLSKEPFLTQAE